MKIKDYFEEKKQLRCPFCNINDCPPIDEEEWEEYKEGFRYYCAICNKCFFEPVVDLSDIQKAVDGMVCSDCGEFNCNCDRYVLNRKNKELIEGKNMLNFSRVIKIIDAKQEGGRKMAKINDTQELSRILKVLDGKQIEVNCPKCLKIVIAKKDFIGCYICPKCGCVVAKDIQNI